MVDFTFGGVEAPSNYQEKTLCVLLLDISGSMTAEGRLDALNQGLMDFYQDIQNNSSLADALEIAIVAFDHNVFNEVAPSLVEDFTMPTLTSRGGLTNMAGAIEEGLRLIDARKDYYRHHGISYKRPWMIMMTDGLWTNEDYEIQAISQKIVEGMDAKRFHFFPIGIKLAPEEMEQLKQITHPSAPPLALDGLKFSDFFVWLSNSMEKISNSRDGDKVAFSDPTSWMKGFSV